MSMAWEPDHRSNFFFNPPAHLCAVTYMTEISLIVTLNNQFHLHLHRIFFYYLNIRNYKELLARTLFSRLYDLANKKCFTVDMIFSVHTNLDDFH